MNTQRGIAIALNVEEQAGDAINVIENIMIVKKASAIGDQKAAAEKDVLLSEDIKWFIRSTRNIVILETATFTLPQDTAFR